MATRNPTLYDPDIETGETDGAFVALRIPLRLIGLAMLVAVGAVLTAFASWSANDPSLSYATDKPVENWLGYPGAVVADLGMQFFGIAAILGIVPLAIWSWGLSRKMVPSHWLLRLCAWLGAMTVTSGVLANIAAPPTWPLPTGLGGIVGGGFTALAVLVTGQAPDGLIAALYALLLTAPAASLFWLSAGVRSLHVPGQPVEDRGDDDESTAGRTGFFDIVFGGMMHVALTARTAWRRAREAARQRMHESEEAETQTWRREAVEPSLDGQGPSPRREHALDDFSGSPDLDSPGADASEVDWSEPEYADEDLYPSEPGEADDAAARDVVERSGGGQSASGRRVATAARVKPGKRVTSEAQGSLLQDDGFQLPELSLLAAPEHGGLAEEHQPEMLEANARKLEGVLEDFGVKGDIINVRPGPVVTLYELEPAPGIKSSRVISLADDIARSMSAVSARVAVVPGRNAIGIELPNRTRETVFLREMLGSSDFEKVKGKLPICLGKTIGGEPIIADLSRMPHLLIAGTTGSGKSVAVNTMILSILYRMTPEQCRLIMIDPKMLELSIYDGIPHLLSPVVTDPSKAVTALKWAVREMEDRYKKMSKIGVRNIDGFNNRVAEAARKGEVISRTVQTGFDRETGEAIYESEEFDLEPLPYIVVIVDEMADLMMVAGKDIEGAIQRLAQMARAAGIHLIMATQRPSVDVITGTIKANFPTRISFQVTSKIDSRTILGEQGAEQLLGMGDMLYMAGGGRIRRLHGPFVDDDEVEDVVGHLKSQGAPAYLESVTEENEESDANSNLVSGSGDDLYDKAVNIVLNDKKASTSYIQRRLSIGYNRAATLIEKMENEGVISPANHAGKREILVGDGVD